MTQIADCRAAFRAAAEIYSGPLYRRWCALAGAQAGPDDGTFTGFASYGLDFANWKSAAHLLRVTSEELRALGSHPALSDYFPVLDGALPPDGRSYQLWTELLRDRRATLGARLQEPPVPLNDPQAGVRMLRLVTRHLQATYAEPIVLDLVAVGAGAGLELVADAFDPGLLAGQRVASRRGYDLRPLDPRDHRVLGRMLSQLEPEDVAAQARVRRAAQLVDERDIVVSRRDAFDVVSSAGFGFGRVPVVFGAAFLCMVPDRTRMDEMMRSRHAEGIWVSEEVVSVLRAVSDDPLLQQAPDAAVARRLAHYRAGELSAEVVEVD